MQNSIFHNSAAVLPVPIQNAAVEHLPCFITSNDVVLCRTHALSIAKAFSAEGHFERLFHEEDEGTVESYQKKLTHSFERNVCRLVEKTWVEESDEERKADTLYHLKQFCRSMELASDEIDYTILLPDCIAMLRDVVVLLFGEQVNTEPERFLAYALRVDPDFGLFWHYLESICMSPPFPQEKARLAIFLGMYFLAHL